MLLKSLGEFCFTEMFQEPFRRPAKRVKEIPRRKEEGEGDDIEGRREGLRTGE